MSRQAIQRLMTLLTLAWALLVPSRARAMIVPICDDDRMSVAPAAEAEPSCAVITSVDGATGETSAAPLCDPRGASMVAPPRVLPIADGRIEAAPGCDGVEMGPTVAPGSQDHAPAGEPASPALFATLPEVAALLPARTPEPAAHALAHVTGGPRAGIARGVYHPPR